MISREEAIAKGIRRIEALSGDEAVRAEEHVERLETRIKNLQKEYGDDKEIVANRARFDDANKQITELLEVRRTSFVVCAGIFA